MKIKYSRYTGEDFGIDGNDLLQALSDFLLESGFNTQYMPFTEMNQRTLEDLKKALQQALEEGKMSAVVDVHAPRTKKRPAPKREAR